MKKIKGDVTVTVTYVTQSCDSMEKCSFRYNDVIWHG